MHSIAAIRCLLFCPFLYVAILSCGDAETTTIEDKGRQSVFDILSSSEVIDLTLITSIDSLIINKEQELYQSAQLVRKNVDGQQIIDTIEVSARGKTRKNYCSIPPIKLKFSEDYLAKRSLAGYKTLKMVIPCQDDEASQDLVLREYLTYRLCQLATDKSFRVQLVALNLETADRQRIDHIKYAFIIEHEEDMARRIGQGLVDETLAKVKSVHQDNYNLLVLFQYMIANTDWNLSARHNIKLVDNGPTSAPTPVPYDFDYCGLVNAEYAIPHPNLPVNNIRERYFQWRGKDQAGLELAMDKILQKQEVILEKVKHFDLLSETTRADITDFINPFFEIISDENRVELLLKEKAK